MFGSMIFSLLPFTAYGEVDYVYGVIWRDSCTGNTTWTNSTIDNVTNLRCGNAR